MSIKFAQVPRKWHRAPCAEQLQVRTCLDVGDTLGGSAKQNGYFLIPEAEAHKDAGSTFLYAEILAVLQGGGEMMESLACQCVELLPVGISGLNGMPAELRLGMEEGHNPTVRTCLFIIYCHCLFLFLCGSFLFAQDSFFTQTLMSFSSEEAASIRTLLLFIILLFFVYSKVMKNRKDG